MAPELIPVWLRLVFVILSFPKEFALLSDYFMPGSLTFICSFPFLHRWARYLCALTYAVRIGLVEEFGNGCGSVEGDINCANLLESVEAVPDETWW